MVLPEHVRDRGVLRGEDGEERARLLVILDGHVECSFVVFHEVLDELREMDDVVDVERVELLVQRTKSRRTRQRWRNRPAARRTREPP